MPQSCCNSWPPAFSSFFFLMVCKFFLLNRIYKVTKSGTIYIYIYIYILYIYCIYIIYIYISNMSYIASAQWLNRAIFIYSGVGINENYIFRNFKSSSFTYVKYIVFIYSYSWIYIYIYIYNIYIYIYVYTNWCVCVCVCLCL